MRTSHLTIRKRILEEKSKITDEQFFASREYSGFLTDIAESATKRYNRTVRVTVKADHDDETVAYTDFTGIMINACNEITWSFPSRPLRSLSLQGLNAHEFGHMLFTDNPVWHSFFRRLGAGRFYPRLPDGLTAGQKQNARDIQEALLDENDPVPKSVILSTAHALSNILEDGYVDLKCSCQYPGTPARGIALNNLRYAELMPDIESMIDKKTYDHNIILNLLIQYVRVRDLNNLSGYDGELLDYLKSFMALVDGCICADDARDRCEAVNLILIDLWPIMQRCFDELRAKYNQAVNAAQGTGPANAGTGSPGDASGQQQSGSAEEQTNDQAAQAQAGQAVEDELSGQLPKSAPNFTLASAPVSSEESEAPEEDQQENVLSEMARVLAEETERIKAHVTNGIFSDGEGGMDTNTGYEGSGYDSAAEDIERLLDTMAEAVVNEQQEQELSEELQREATSISYGNAHRNIHITINRMTHVTPEMIESYNRVAPDLLTLSKRLQRSVSAVLRDKRQGGKQTGLFCGKRLNQHALYRSDGRIFYNSRLPTEPINLSVGLLVDESGSMCGSDRITRARATAIVMQDFCESLGIPLMIVGHTAWSSRVQLFSYSDFDSRDKNDRYRLMDMSARDCNRDGAALRFLAEKLARQVSDMKILIIICDGQPNDDGYSGSAAEADLRGIKLEFSRRGVQIFAAAIGDDRPNIERIYGEGYLDITDLNDLPVMLTNLIARHLPH
jgi:Nitric oxide reductase activation protein